MCGFSGIAHSIPSKYSCSNRNRTRSVLWSEPAGGHNRPPPARRRLVSLCRSNLPRYTARSCAAPLVEHLLNGVRSRSLRHTVMTRRVELGRGIAGCTSITLPAWHAATVGKSQSRARESSSRGAIATRSRLVVRIKKWRIVPENAPHSQETIAPQHR